MNHEYEMLRSEMMENIKKQETINNAIISILSVSYLFSTFYTSRIFLLFMIFFSSVLLAKVQQCRDVVYRISTYLKKFEQHGKTNINWENNIAAFNQELTARPSILPSPVLRCLFWVRGAHGIKNFGPLAMTSFLMYRLLELLGPIKEWTPEQIIPFSIAALFYLLNIIFTFSITFDYPLKDAYSAIWEKVFHEEMGEK